MSNIYVLVIPDEERGQGLLGLLNSDDVYPLQAPVEPKCMKILGHHYDFDDEDMFHDLLENPLGTHPKPEFIGKRKDLCNDCLILWTRAPCQYKDRLIYVWRFPC